MSLFQIDTLDPEKMPMASNYMFSRDNIMGVLTFWFMWPLMLVLDVVWGVVFFFAVGGIAYVAIYLYVLLETTLGRPEPKVTWSATSSQKSSSPSWCALTPSEKRKRRVQELWCF